MKEWCEFDLTTGKYTGKKMLFIDGITPDYYFNIRDPGWIISKNKSCINITKNTTWHIKKSPHTFPGTYVYIK